jgi:hypothetical protein
MVTLEGSPPNLEIFQASSRIQPLRKIYNLHAYSPIEEQILGRLALIPSQKRRVGTEEKSFTQPSIKCSVLLHRRARKEPCNVIFSKDRGTV